MKAENLERILNKVWEYLQQEKCNEFVPWVVNPKSEKYDPYKHGRNDERKELINNIIEVIKEQSEIEQKK